ncbi:MAG TPA: heme ABC transporter ATP-binding protein [Thermomicrobiales bacterium]|jgi:heme transport system ATP-binding protein|nr:heme ABC transporter ATP-binding protein [Thermomicrobiales bacterium]
MTDPQSARLILTDVSYSIGGAILLQGVSLAVQPGEVLVLVGPNGAGKSTLMNVISGDLAPTSGEVMLDGRAIGSYRPNELALRRAVLPQQSLLQFAFTVREVVEMGRTPHDDTADELRQHVQRALERTEMIPFADRVYPSLSGGEKARAQLGRVLAQETPLLLLDEPTASLDIRHQQHVMHLAQDVAAEGGSVVAVIHDLNLAASAAHRIALLHRGRIVADGPPWVVMDEKQLSEVYQCPIAVSKHPILHCPLILPLGRNGATSS